MTEAMKHQLSKIEGELVDQADALLAEIETDEYQTIETRSLEGALEYVSKAAKILKDLQARYS